MYSFPPHLMEETAPPNWFEVDTVKGEPKAEPVIVALPLT
jgi:hypothetical protein